VSRVTFVCILPFTIDKSHNNAVYVFEYCSSLRMLEVIVETCSSTSVNQILVKLIGNKLLYIDFGLLAYGS
jgi:hypothetical protein